MSEKKLYRSHNKLISGVCAGIGEYYDIEPTVVRILWVLVAVASLGFAVLAYLACWAIIPMNPFLEKQTEQNSSITQTPPSPQAPKCSTCGEVPKYLPKENGWYCYNCGHYVPEREY